jgi:hypothetical protein
MLAVNLAALLDLSPHLDLPIKATPVLLAAAAVAAWRQMGGETIPGAAEVSRGGVEPVPAGGTGIRGGA